MAWFRGIRLKLILLVLVSTFAICLQVYSAWTSEKELFNITKIFKEERLSVTADVSGLGEGLSYVFRFTWLSIAQKQFNGDAEASWKKAERALEAVKGSIVSLKTQQLSADGLKALDKIDADLNEITNLRTSSSQAIFHGDDISSKKTANEFVEKVLQIGKDINDQIRVLEKNVDERNTFFATKADNVYKSSMAQLAVLSVATFAFLWAFAIFITVFLIRQLSASIKSVSETSEVILSSSQKLGLASEQLATSSQEQSSSVDETSSSLEEISGIVASSLKNSQQSVDMTHKVSGLVSSGTESMSELQTSVNELSDVNNRVQKLAGLIEEIGIKTQLIDEIVFQTKLLSFNASIEAERAGEHGRGFAVVAQEVGNLAQMSGKSASEISQIVKSSIAEAKDVLKLSREKVERGVSLCATTSEQFKAIEVASKEILSGAQQSLRSSEEQNMGIQQINRSIQLISRTTQENASSADSCLSASHDLTSQGQSLDNVVGALETLVYGSKKKASTSLAEVIAVPTKVDTQKAA